jgi:AcrR family transcriptional regulator
MAQKRGAIVAAARDGFLGRGYSEASMDSIAASASVSVKTIYSHFRNKAELFSAVLEAACTDQDGLFTHARTDNELATKFAWFQDASLRGLAEAGEQYLTHLLSAEQVALYRVVTRDSERFPELGQLYQTNIAHGRTKILVAYLARTAHINNWKPADPRKSARIFEALLRADVFEEVLHGVRAVGPEAIAKRARAASQVAWRLLEGSTE